MQHVIVADQLLDEGQLFVEVLELLLGLHVGGLLVRGGVLRHDPLLHVLKGTGRQKGGITLGLSMTT